MIRYLKHNDIDYVKWDKCVSQSPNALLYGYSWFLNLSADHWDALVLDDYDAVMPLPWRKKWGVHYLYQPEMMQQGGVFSSVNLNEDLLSDFMQAIPSHFRLVEIMLNYANDFSLKETELRRNLILNLNNEIGDLQQAYSDNCRRNIKKSGKENYSLNKNFEWNNIMHLFAENKGRDLQISEYWKKRMTSIAHALYHKGIGKSISLFNSHNQCVAGIFYVYFEQRIYFLFSGSGEEAKNSGAMHYLVDMLIQQYAGGNGILDFEGSNNEGLARFYKSFGAVEQNYPMLKINRLPFFMRWLKK
jgi:lipid II:glycine glycyltransferase (peptidoglycan interpeptide bridge formation enzyme)